MSLAFRKDFMSSQSLVSQVGPNLTLVNSSITPTKVNSSGFLEAVAANTPRFTYDPITLALKGLWIEGTTRTNQAIYNQDLTATGWVLEDATIDSNAAVSPDGLTEFDRINVSVTNARHGVYRTSASSLNAATPYTISAFFKDDGAGFCVLSAGNTGDWFGAIFNLTTGAAVGSTVGTTGTYTAAGSEDWGNGLYRVWVTGLFGTSTSKYTFLCPSESASPTISFGRPTYLATAGADVFAWGPNLIASKHIESFLFNPGASATTRSSDVLSTSDMSWWNQNQGTLYFRGRQFHVALQENAMPAIYEGSTYRFRTRANAGSGAVVVLVVPTAGNSWIAGTTGTIVHDTQFELVLSCAENNGDCFLDGASIGSTVSLDVPWPATIFQTDIPGVDDFNGIIEEIRYYNTKVDDTVGLAMSSGTFPVEVSGSGQSGPGLSFGSMGRMGA